LIDHTGADETTSINVENKEDVCSNILSLKICKPETKTETRQQKRIKDNIGYEPPSRDII
jgi:hypothetical protein